MKMQFMGHSPSEENPNWQTLENHVSGVTRRTEQHVRYMATAIPELTVYAPADGLFA